LNGLIHRQSKTTLKHRGGVGVHRQHFPLQRSKLDLALSQNAGDNMSQTEGTDSKVQGEGDYDAARRYREKVTDFVQRSDVEELVRQGRALSAKEAREMALAEERARARSKGDDPADVGIMYSHNLPESET
jgi:hypothetical protein